MDMHADAPGDEHAARSASNSSDEQLRESLKQLEARARVLLARSRELASAWFDLGKFLVQEHTRFFIIKLVVVLHIWLLLLATWVVGNRALALVVATHSTIPYAPMIAVLAVHLAAITALILYFRKLKL